ncbi:MAG: VapC toxin family PIN domain ribonuclease, partial [Gemmatimonadetes bacterium]|nr:VapC toxin family PIN domain ribonuclease [Gemmatimonadota bacterium]NIR78875.1 VapC toxin family PIN domain ribonuclease [Gemmatimonadota bacterium]NIT87521.1 VapC toxin family PIN domain ribonuclease [Gemmatimonadota bacterium]NIU31388.1 VapC toxin family PIN domain ribonuclease [Gemmatimonadota bacterium]NIU36063.1 VapC toxin family PIN domain ribonuclease [Gemmatimonadota bacterium]
DAVVLMEDAVVLMDGREYAVPSERVLRAVGDAPAGDEGASACDAEFAVLSRDLGVPLVTVDGRALRSFPDVAVSPEAFLA